MFVTPMISVYPSDFDRKQKQYSLNRSSTSSSGSSDASSLHRTSSTNSNASNSRWSTSSISSVETNTVATRHRKRSSRVSFNLPRPLQPFHKKVQSQPHIQLPQSPRSHPPPRPARPEEIIQSLVQPKHSVDILRPPEVQPKAEGKRPTQKLRKRSDSAPIAVAATQPIKDSPEWPNFTLPAPPPPPPPSSTPLTPPLTPSSPGAQWQCSDLVVRCKSDVYHVDRTIMCYHSNWFARVCAIMTSPKASKSVIDLSADDADAVAAMMQYCYQLDYTNKSFSTDCGIDEVADLRPHVAVYMLAERYGMAGLKRTALEKFEDLATTVLKISGDEEQFMQAVSAMYAPTRRANADELRRVAVQICADHVQGFISGSHATMAMVFESMDSLPEFRSDLFEEMARRWK